MTSQGGGCQRPLEEAAPLPPQKEALDQWFSVQQNSPEGSLNTDGCIPPLEFLMSWASVGPRSYVLPSSQVVPIGLL